MVVADDGLLSRPPSIRARVRNRAQLTYNAVGAWLEGKAAAPPKVAASADLQAQLKPPERSGPETTRARHRLGALNFDRLEPQAVIADGQVQDIRRASQPRRSVD